MITFCISSHMSHVDEVHRQTCGQWLTLMCHEAETSSDGLCHLVVVDDILCKWSLWRVEMWLSSLSGSGSTVAGVDFPTRTRKKMWSDNPNQMMMDLPDENEFITSTTRVAMPFTRQCLLLRQISSRPNNHYPPLIFEVFRMWLQLWFNGRSERRSPPPHAIGCFSF